MQKLLYTKKRAFSLVEVIVAVGIFAIAIIAVIGLMVPIRASVAEVRDGEDASRLATLIQAELQRQSFPTIKGFLDTPPAAGLYASRDIRIVALGNDSKWGTASGSYNPDAEKFYKIDLIRDAILSPNSSTHPDADSGYLAFTIKLTWPVFASAMPGSTSVPADARQQSTLLLPAAITR